MVLQMEKVDYIQLVKMPRAEVGSESQVLNETLTFLNELDLELLIQASPYISEFPLFSFFEELQRKWALKSV